MILKWIIIVLATINFGFMAFDGARGLILGDYLRPKSGPHAGQLGPWSKVVTLVGIDPESTLMKTIFLVWGLVGLIISFLFAFDPVQYRTYLIIVSATSLWNLLPGTIINILQIILLLFI